MLECPLPNYDNYLRYAAYKEVFAAVMSDIKSRNVARPSAAVLCSIVHSHELDLTTKYGVEAISPYDDVETLLAKKYATELNDTYRDYILEATEAFTAILASTQRTTIHNIERLLENQIRIVTEDLLKMV